MLSDILQVHTASHFQLPTPTVMINSDFVMNVKELPERWWVFQVLYRARYISPNEEEMEDIAGGRQ